MGARSLMAFSALAIMLTGCASTKYNDFEKYDASNVDWTQLEDGEENFYKNNRQHEDGRPKIGLALSGGGQRAASVSIGFLKALDEKNILSKIDTVSSVSGGSYAAYWWYTKNYWAIKNNEPSVLQRGENNEDSLIFETFTAPSLCKELKDPVNKEIGCYDDEARLQRYKENRFHYHNYNHGYLLTFAQQYKSAQILEFTGKVSSWVVTTPIHWLANGLFDMKLNLNLFQNYYQNGIERDYGLYPTCEAGKCVPLKSYANSKNRFNLDKSTPTPTELFESIKDQKLPYWVINTTAAYSKKSWPKMFRGAAASGYSKMLANTVYEFTPSYQGSPKFSFSQYENISATDSVDLSRMVALSGAAFDNFSPAGNSVTDLVNLSLGQYIRNPTVDSQTKLVHRMLPIPFYWFHHNQHDETSPFIYLSDGGHSEDNLGIYSLIRRGVKQLIVLDSEEETNKNFIAKFESLRKTRCLLMLERGLLIDLPDAKIDEAACEFDEKKMGESGKFNVRKTDNPILSGQICKAEPGIKSCDGKETVATIIYAKLSVSEDIFKPIPPKIPPAECLSNQRYSCNSKWFSIHNNEGRFPHDPTIDIFYSPDQYSGYQSLGYDIGKLIKINEPEVAISQAD